MNTTDQTKPMTEAAALSDILDWSLDRPPWLGDALRRLVTQDGLTEEDYDALVRISINPDDGYEPLAPQHVAAERLPGNPVALLGIREVWGVNALASQQELQFTPNGLNIVYGDNGSGKSGYVRILKHACRSRDKKNIILSDVNDATHAEKRATLLFQCGQSEDSFAWSPEEDGHADLPAISIFDSRSANTHLQEESDVAYIPYPMLLLQQLVTISDELRQRLSDKIETLKAQTPSVLRDPDIDPNTEAGAFLLGLKASSSLITLDALAAIGDHDRKRIVALQADLNQDPDKAISALKKRKARLLECVEDIRKLHEAASDGNIQALQAAQSEMNTKTEVAKAASEALFATSPLPDIGSDVWKALWEAARNYSDSTVYPDHSFPNYEGEAHCVLCQQPLSPAARERWSTFESFVKGTTKADEVAATAIHQQKIQAAETAFPNLELWISKLRGVREDFDDISLSRAIRKSLMSAAHRLRDMSSSTVPSTQLVSLPQHTIDAVISDIDNRISSLSADEQSEARKALQFELQQLRDRRLLHTLKADILAEIERLKEIAAIEKAKRTVSPKQITDKTKEVSDLLVTNALRQRFMREVEKLQIGTMPIELVKERDSKGKSLYKIKLVGMPKQPIGEVLSEGEHRCVALAAFLSEIFTAREYSGIVFDDPMSSLDHIYRERVAKRLVEEAEHRQVIVFTHDLSFLFGLTEEADKAGRHVHFQTIMRKSQKPGFVENDLPMKAKKAKAMSATIKADLKQLKGSFDNSPLHVRERTAQGLINQLRQTWEQGVADYVQPVLQRFHSHVSPSSLFKLLVLTPDDVQAVNDAYSRLSVDVHASVETLNPATVGHEDLDKEVKILDAWLIDISKRQKEAELPE